MVMEWQPIETAPRDGTEIIAACFASGGFGLARFCRWHKSRSGLRKGIENWCLRGTQKPIYPTHWMPLPDQPK